MLKVSWRKASAPAREMDEGELIAELQAMAANGFEGAPEGPVTVIGLDARSRVLWRGDYPSPASMTALLRQLVYERSLRAASSRP